MWTKLRTGAEQIDRSCKYSQNTEKGDPSTTRNFPQNKLINLAQLFIVIDKEKQLL